MKPQYHVIPSQQNFQHSEVEDLNPRTAFSVRGISVPLNNF